MARSVQYIQIKKHHDHQSKLRRIYEWDLLPAENSSKIIHPGTKCGYMDRGEDAILHIKERGQQSLPLQYHLPLQALLTSSSWNSLLTSRLGHTVLFPCFQTPSGFVISRCLQQGSCQEGRRKTIHAWVQTASRENWMVAKTLRMWEPASQYPYHPSYG